MKEQVKKLVGPGVVQASHKARGMAAYYLWGRKSKRMKLIGVTGTNGKTTTCFLITSILESAGFRVGMATTVKFKVGAKEWANELNMTTVSPFKLHRLLAEMAEAGCEYAVLEITSHALAQYRNWGLKFHTTVFTNLTHDHLDFHGTLDNYRAIKGKLFLASPQVSIVNIDDDSANYFLNFPAFRKYTVGIDHRGQVTARKILPDPDGTLFTLVTPTGQLPINLKLAGRFNVYNALEAAAVAEGLGIPLDVIKSGLEQVEQIPGRLEMVSAGQPYTIIIDYAHTPDALEKVYSTIKPSVRGKMICVLGATGDRDKTKRPILGSIAGRLCDSVIITDEEPYSEDPATIIKEVAGGVPRGAAKGEAKIAGENFFTVPERREGIKQAFAIAQKGDIVVITGMGAQTYKVVKGAHVPWSDKKVVLDLLKSQ